MSTEIIILISAAVLGIPSALTPGPFLTILISETLTHGKSRGLKIAFVPLFSDLPIVIFSFAVVLQFTKYDMLLGIIALIGATYISYLSLELFKIQLKDIVIKVMRPLPFYKLVSINLMNPNIYVFWLTIGAPLALSARGGTVFDMLFVLIFYFTMIGSKLLVVYTIDWFSVFLTGKRYILTMRLLGGVLLLFALYFLKDGLQFLGII